MLFTNTTTSNTTNQGGKMSLQEKMLQAAKQREIQETNEVLRNSLAMEVDHKITYLKPLDEKDIAALNKIDAALNEKEEKLVYYEGDEECPHCGTHIDYKVNQYQWTTTCPNCDKRILLCSKCNQMYEGGDKCAKCNLCDLVNFRNFLKGNVSLDDLFATFTPPLVDRTAGLPYGVIPTFEMYLSDTHNNIQWDVNYWSVYESIMTSGLTDNSSDMDCLGFINELKDRNANINKHKKLKTRPQYRQFNPYNNFVF